MGKLTELKTTQDLVKHILTTEPRTRNSDDLLYIRVCEIKGGEAVNLPLWRVLLNRKEYGIPPFESVRRSGQKVRAAYPELAGSDEVEAQRKVNEEAFREFARGNV